MPNLPTESIFISYSRRDKEAMQKIAFFLRDQGFKVWVDNEKLIPGTAAWEQSIEDALKRAFAVIVILSPDSKNSEWVRREITYADQFNKRVFPVLIKGDEDDSLPLRLVTRQYVDLRTDEDAGLTALRAAIDFYIEKNKPWK
ncbi:MAG: toll/interleukin-1 receptor domain-containing protein [Chloroflexi bacterium]|nr:toll/interleukin-1 receptor domain-containing protein [Chloroflexota bacterium]